MTWTQRYNGTVTYCASASNIPVSGPVLSGVEGYPLPITSGNILIKEGANAGILRSTMIINDSYGALYQMTTAPRPAMARRPRGAC